MIKRNIILEGKIKSWLNNLSDVEFDNMDNVKKALLLQAVEVLYKGTDDEDYLSFVMEKADTLVSNDGKVNFKKGEEVSNLYLGNALVFVKNTVDADIAQRAAKACGADSKDIKDTFNKYTSAVVEVAKQFATQRKNAIGVFANDNETDVDILAATLKSQVFYMNYETLLGGKERYNDIIAQFNNLQSDTYNKVLSQLKDEVSNGALYNTAQYEAIVYYMCSLIDTMEVMAQPLYEIYDALKSYFKVVVKDTLDLQKKCTQEKHICEGGVCAFTKSAVSAKELYEVYAILKGCRMKALHTEKYENEQLEVINATIENVCKDFDKFDSEYIMALVMAYGESLRNREYQDYGRNKGGVLWS